VSKQNLTYAQKIKMCNREALISVGVLALIVVVWIALGFGLSGSPVRILGIPLWVLTGTVGTWLVAVIAAVVLSRVFFADFSLEDEEEGEGEGVLYGEESLEGKKLLRGEESLEGKGVLCGEEGDKQ